MCEKPISEKQGDFGRLIWTIVSVTLKELNNKMFSDHVNH